MSQNAYRLARYEIISTVLRTQWNEVPLDSSVKDKASFGSVRLRVVLLPTILTLLSVKWPDRQADLMYSPFRAVLRSLRLSSSKASALEVPPPTDICNCYIKYLL